MVILDSLIASYIINGDGSQRSDVGITSPNNVDIYTRNAQSVVVAGQLHLFGGVYADSRKVNLFLFFFKTKYFFKIARLDGCAIVKLSVKLSNDFSSYHAALATENGSKGLQFFKSNFVIF